MVKLIILNLILQPKATYYNNPMSKSEITDYTNNYFKFWNTQNSYETDLVKSSFCFLSLIKFKVFFIFFWFVKKNSSYHIDDKSNKIFYIIRKVKKINS